MADDYTMETIEVMSGLLTLVLLGLTIAGVALKLRSLKCPTCGAFPLRTTPAGLTCSTCGYASKSP